jgi:hypothetical protein
LFLIFEALKLYLFLPYTDNEGAFVLIGREMGRGARLYSRHLGPQAAPALRRILAAAIISSTYRVSSASLRFLIHALNALLIFVLAKRLEFSRGGAWASPLGLCLLLFRRFFKPGRLSPICSSSLSAFVLLGGLF